MGVETTTFFIAVVGIIVTILGSALGTGLVLWCLMQKGFDQVIARLDHLADDHRRIAALADIRVQIAEINGDVALVEQKVTRVKSEVGELRDEMRARPGGGATPAPGTAGD